MKKTLALVLAASIAPVALADTETIKKALTEKMPGVQINAVTKSPYAGLYEVVANGFNVFYTDEKAEIGVFNGLIDLRTRKNLTEQRKEDLMKVDVSQLPVDKAIVKIKGDGSRKLYIFSDPDCPYCRQLEKELEGIDNVTMYTFLYPLASIHPDAVRKAEVIWCSGDRAQAYYDLMLAGKEPQGQPTCSTPVEDIIRLAEKLHISGTPGMVFGNGKLVPGGLPRHQIEALLDAQGKS